MKTAQKNYGIIWATGASSTTLFVKPVFGGYQWTMVSAKTGKHVLIEGPSPEPVMTERVKNHWNGFQINQNR